ncbi:hypothetical protein WMY93_014165 [Mugilogobius chulae]|uniref:UDP-glucuronosyltransferase n=1 Tax=Mugilogobius chulae TaxID=88201 RepID=A0AAW0NTQ5_9GOBI
MKKVSVKWFSVTFALIWACDYAGFSFSSLLGPAFIKKECKMRSLPLSPVFVLLVLTLVGIQVGPALGGKVLVLPGEFSHWLNMKSLIQELRTRNHSISILTPSGTPSVKYNDTELQKQFEFIIFKVSFTAADYKGFLDDFMHFSMYESHKASVWTKARLIYAWLGRSNTITKQYCEGMIENTELMSQLRDAKFDLVLWDPMSPCGDLVAQLLDVPIVASLRFTFGAVIERHCGHAPLPPSYVPSSPLPYSDVMTFRERVISLLVNLLSSIVSELYWKFEMDSYYSEILGQSTTVCDSVGRTSMWLIRTFWDIESPRPMPPNFRYVGGLHCKPAKPLPKVIWRYSGPTPRSLGPNTKLLPWIPQNDLLGHPQTRAFVAHGGTNGIYEALFHGVPIVGIPLFGDQSDNLARVSRRGGAVVLNFNTMTSEEMSSTISEVINNPSYTESMRRASAIHRDRPLTALQEAAFWVEFVLRNGASHLRLASYELNWFQYHSLDTVAFLLLITAAIITVMVLITRKGLRLVLRLLRGSRPHQD